MSLIPSPSTSPLVHNLDVFKNRLKGQTVLLIGSGQSTEQLNSLPWYNYFSISINYSQLKYPSGMCGLQDSEIWRTNGDYARHFKRTNVIGIHPRIFTRGQAKSVADRSIRQQAYRGYYCNCKAAYFKRECDLDIWDEEYHKTNSLLVPTYTTGSVILWILTYYLQVNKIILVGFDANPQHPYKYGIIHPKHGYRNAYGKGASKLQYPFLARYNERFQWINSSYSDWGTQVSLRQALSGEVKNANIIRDIREDYCSLLGERDEASYRQLPNPKIKRVKI